MTKYIKQRAKIITKELSRTIIIYIHKGKYMKKRF